MTHEQEIYASPAGQPIRAEEPAKSLTFGHDNAFQLELRRRVAEYFRTTGRRQRDCWQMYVKTAIFVAGFAGSYVLLVFGAQTWWQGLLLAMLLGLSAVVVTWLVGGLNFQIEHHLFPRISHVNYPAISKLVEQTCRDFGVRYAEFKSFRAGIASHFRWLRRMGRANATG